MQNKVIIRLFAIAFTLASLYELSFTWMTQRVESQIAEQVNHDPERLNYALDSLSDHTVYNLGVASFTYKELKSKEMNLGLDLRGGMNVILEVSVRDVLLGLAGDADDPQLRQAIEEADAAQTNSQDAYLTLFFTSMDAIRGDRKLNDPALYGTKDMTDRDGIGFNATDELIKTALAGDVEAAITNVYTVLKARIDQFGVVQPNIQRLDGTGRILVELPGVKDPARMQRLLQSTARLEFWRVDQGSEWMQFIVDANVRLRSVIEAPRSASHQLTGMLPQMMSQFSNWKTTMMQVLMKQLPKMLLHRIQRFQPSIPYWMSLPCTLISRHSPHCRVPSLVLPSLVTRRRLTITYPAMWCVN